MGLFEQPPFAKGSKKIIEAIAQVKGNNIIAGGETIEIAKKAVSLASFDHLSLAGGATLEFLSAKKLPALEFLKVEN